MVQGFLPCPSQASLIPAGWDSTVRGGPFRQRSSPAVTRSLEGQTRSLEGQISTLQGQLLVQAQGQAGQVPGGAIARAPTTATAADRCAHYGWPRSAFVHVARAFVAFALVVAPHSPPCQPAVRPDRCAVGFCASRAISLPVPAFIACPATK